MLHMPTASENYTKSNSSNNNNNNNVASGCSRNSRSSKKKGPAPFMFFSNMLKKKKILEIDDIMFDREMNHRARSEPSVVSYSCTQMGLPIPRQTSPSISTLSLTPGRCRDIDQDMHAIRLSRQDNPFIQKVLASRESLADMEEMVSDDAILIQDFNSQVEPDPFQMPEVHEHMIRSPPPTSWPRNPNFSIFNFPQDNNNTITSQSSGDSTHSAIYFNSELMESKQNSKTGLHKNLSSSAIPRPHSSHQSDYNRQILSRPSSQLEKFPSNCK